MTKENLEKEVKRLEIELEKARQKTEELSAKEYEIGKRERCFLYDEMFGFIKEYLRGGGEIILRPMWRDEE